MNSNVFQVRKSRAIDQLLLGDFHRAIEILRSLIRKRPRDPDVWGMYGCAAAGLGLKADALQAWDKARELASNDPSFLVRLGHHYRSVAAFEKARHCFEIAGMLSPLSINPQISQAILLEKENRFNEARVQIDSCLQINRKDEQARFVEAFLAHREGKIESAERSLRDLIKSDLRHPYVKYACRYELANVLDKMGVYDEAMRILAEAKRIVSTLADIDALLSQYDESANNFRNIAQSLPIDVVQKWNVLFPNPQRELLKPLAFIGGHPRSGTTLLEQIIGAHPSVKSYDETETFKWIARTKIPNLVQFSPLSPNQLNALRREYMACLQQDDDICSRRELLVDKNPSLTVFLPTWLYLFPDLKVIIALRDPRDVIISCYFLNLPLNVINANLLSLNRLAKHYSDLMSVWRIVREWKEFSWTETRYEDMVKGMEAEGQRVTRHLGLRWHQDQLTFYKCQEQNRISAPTYSDVTKSVYTRSVARWLSYERYLSPIQHIVQPFCDLFGYS